MTSQIPLYAVFGNPIDHSLSPVIHQDFARQFGIQLHYDKRAPMGKESFSDMLSRFSQEKGVGANVTLPFKVEAAKICQGLTDRARWAGAVNTLKKDDEGNWHGDNTDGMGFLQDVSANLNFSTEGKRVLLLGAGGSARGLLAPLLLHTGLASLTIVNRTANRALSLLELADTVSSKANISAGGMDLLSETLHPFDLVINATSASLGSQSLSVPTACFADNSLAYELLYGRVTPFMSLAKKSGAVVSDGLGMLVEQAALSFYWWHRKKPQTDQIQAILRARVHST